VGELRRDRRRAHALRALDRVEVDTSRPRAPRGVGRVWRDQPADQRRPVRAHGLELPFNVVMETVRVGGITSVGTHGSGRETSTLGDLVEAFEVIDARGERRVLSEATVGAEVMSAARLCVRPLRGDRARAPPRRSPRAPVRLHNERLPVARVRRAPGSSALESEESAELLWMPFASVRGLRRVRTRTVGPLPPRRGLAKSSATSRRCSCSRCFITAWRARRAPLLPSLLRSVPTSRCRRVSRSMRRSEAIHYRRWLEVRRCTCVEVGFKVDD
jgi:hypothetical protein